MVRACPELARSRALAAVRCGSHPLPAPPPPPVLNVRDAKQAKHAVSPQEEWCSEAAKLTLLRSKDIRPKYVKSTFQKARTSALSA